MKKTLVIILSVFVFYQANATIYPVTIVTDNTSGTNPAAFAGTGTLRQAIVDANAHAGKDTITFNIAAGGTVKTILLLASLPTITDSIFMNGYSQSGAVQGPIGSSRTITIQIDANKKTTGGSRPAGTENGLFRFAGTADSSALCGLAIYNTGNGLEPIAIEPGASKIRIWGNYIGLLASGASPASTNYNGGDGVLLGDYNNLSGSFTNIFIGTDGNGINDANEGNAIGNSAANTGVAATCGGDGIQVGVIKSSTYSTYTYTNIRISGNYIGITADGATGAPNGILLTTLPGAGEDGINLVQASNLLIGSNGDGVSDALERNIISGNYGNGINSGLQITSGKTNGQAGKISIAGNYIGTDKTGMIAVPNALNTKSVNVHGIGIGSGTSNMVVGFDDTKHTAAVADSVRNIVSGNFNGGSVANGVANGVHISNGTGTGNKVCGNYIGVAADGVTALGNGSSGITVSNTSSMQIGTNGDGVLDSYEKNIISGNYRYGIFVYQSNDVRIKGNYIGTDKTGMIAVSNGKSSAGSSFLSGIHLDGAMSGLVIGFDAASNIATVAADTRNIISGNYSNGIKFQNVSGLGNTVAGNYIGVNATGNTALGNGQANTSTIPGSGIDIDASSGLVIGTNADGTTDVQERNIIGGAILGHGINIRNGSSNSYVSGNYIGVGANGTTAVGNAWSGVRLGATVAGSNAINNIIGSDDSWGASDDIEPNIIANNGTAAGTAGQRAGVSVVSNSTTNSTGNRISRNIFYNNKGLPIDLNDDGITLNDGTTTATGVLSANIALDYPVITSASVSGTTVTVAGYVSTCGGAENTAGPNIAGSKIIQFYKEANDGDQDGALTNGSCTRVVNHGEGIQYLGSITGIVNTFSTSFTLVAGATFTASDKIAAITIDANGNTSEFGVNTVLIILPVQLLNFTAAQKGNIALLNWSTATESNNRGFDIERSADGIHFNKIGFVGSAAAGGNSTTLLHYTSTDAQPLEGINYYRLKQTDFDGKINYSVVATVNFRKGNGISLSAYPNPVSSELSITIAGITRFTQAHITVYSAVGQVVRKTNVTRQTSTIDCSKFQEGVYFIVYTDGAGNRMQTKVTKN